MRCSMFDRGVEYPCATHLMGQCSFGSRSSRTICSRLAQEVGSSVGNMDDVFADALQESAGDEEELLDMSSMAPSQDTAHQDSPGDSSGTIVLSDDGGDSGTFPISAATTTIVAPKHRKESERRSSAFSKSQIAKKSKAMKDQPVKLVAMPGATNVECIVLHIDNRAAAVPLWCQYRAEWRGIDFGGQAWLIISSY